MSAAAPTDVSGLLLKFVQTLLPPSSTGSSISSSQSTASQNYLHSLSLRLLRGRPRWSGGLDEARTVQQAKKEICLRVGGELGYSHAVQFEQLYRKLMHIHSTASSGGAAPLLNHRAEVVHFLQQMQGQAERDTQQAGAAGLVSNYYLNQHTAPNQQSFQPAGYLAAPSPSPSPNPSQSQSLTTLQNNAQQLALQSQSQSQSLSAKLLLQHSSSDVSESELLRDILYTLLGADGNFVKYHPGSDAYLLLPSINVSRPVRMLVQRIAELGWLYRKVQKYVTDVMEGGGDSVAAPTSSAASQSHARQASRKNSMSGGIDLSNSADHSGKIEQSFAATLRDELNDYLRLITLLETQVETQLRAAPPKPRDQSLIVPPGGNVPTQHPASQFTLRRMLVWIQDPLQRMALLAMLTDSAKGVKGGCLASVIGTHLRHGDPLVVALMKRVMRKTCVPLFEMMDDWIRTGEIIDPYAEFFIASTGAHAPERLWFDKFQLRRGMIPSFFNAQLVNRILSIGKAVNFIRVNCKDTKYTLQWKMDYNQMFANGTDLSIFTASIESAFNRVNAHLLELLVKQYHFYSHALAVKKFLLLSQGDFITHLLDLVAPELSKSTRDVSHAQLLGILEAAKRGSSARYEPEEVLGRVSLKRMQAKSADEDGWGYFSLIYILDDSPLTVLYSEANLNRYLRLFNFLWKLKRVEKDLNQSWAQSKIGHGAALRKLGFMLGGDGNNVDALEPFLRSVSGLRHEMSHFLSNTHSYMMFEVLECAWDEFIGKIQASVPFLTQPTMGNTVNPATMQFSPTTTTGGAGSTVNTARLGTNPNTPAGTAVSFANAFSNPSTASSTALTATTAPSGLTTPSAAVSSTTAPSASPQPAAKEQKPLDLDGLILAHKLFLQQIMDKALMGGDNQALLSKLLDLFSIVLSFSRFTMKLYDEVLSKELERRAEIELNIQKSESKGGWNRAANLLEANRNMIPASFHKDLAACVTKFESISHAFHVAFFNFLRELKQTNRNAALATKLARGANAHAAGGNASGDEEDESDVAPVGSGLPGGILAASAASRDDDEEFDAPPLKPDPQNASSTVSMRARRAAWHLHDLDFLRFRLDFNEYYAVNKKAAQQKIAQYAAAHPQQQQPQPQQKSIVSARPAISANSTSRPVSSSARPAYGQR